MLEGSTASQRPSRWSPSDLRSRLEFVRWQAETCSHGFFDSNDTPAWDTWVAYIQERERPDGYTGYLRAYVLCWIPPRFLELADAAISVNSNQCLSWVTQQNIDYGFALTLKTAGII